MAKITWGIGDAFQVLATKEHVSSIEVEIYGVFTKSGNVCIAKRGEPTGEQEVLSARGNFGGRWTVVHNSATAEEGYPGAVPIDTKNQWMPKEVELVLVALEMAENPPNR